VDLNDEAIAALREEVALQRQSFSLSFVGLPADCAAAVQDMQDQIQVLACHAVDKPPPPPPKARSLSCSTPCGLAWQSLFVSKPTITSCYSTNRQAYGCHAFGDVSCV